MSDDCDFKLPLLKECQPLDLPTIVPENYELEFPLLKPPCIPSFSGSATVTVRPVKLNESNQPINKDIKLVSDSNSECSYKMSGNIDICVPEADAYIDGADIKWYNKGGTKTTVNNGSPLIPATSGTISSYNPATQYVFKFWNCSDASATDPDRSQVIAANGTNGTNGANGTTPCLINADAYEEVSNVVANSKIYWFNVDGTKTTINGTAQVAPDIVGGNMTYNTELTYVFKFWKCNLNLDGPADRTVSIKPSFSSVYPLKLISYTSGLPASIRVVSGTVANQLASAGMNGGDVPVYLVSLATNAVYYIYCHFDVTYDTNYAYWYPTNNTRTIVALTATQASQSGIVYMLIGTVNVVAGVPNPSNNVTGSQTWSRSGTPNSFYDLFYKT